MKLVELDRPVPYVAVGHCWGMNRNPWGTDEIHHREPPPGHQYLVYAEDHRRGQSSVTAAWV